MVSDRREAGRGTGSIALVRVILQLGILLWYTFVPLATWQVALISVSGAWFVTTTFVLIAHVNQPKSHLIQRFAILVEGAVVVALCLGFDASLPSGPAVLLILPTLLTIALLFPAATKSWLVLLPAIGLFVFSAWVACSPRNAPLLAGVVLPGIGYSSITIRVLLFCLYGSLYVVTGAVMALIQNHLHQQVRFATVVEQASQQSKALTQANQRLKTYADQVYELATASERNRIAGEIHDTVAHRLTALLVQLQAARRLALVDTTQAKENLAVCEALAREALQDVRVSVRHIRKPAQVEGTDVLRRLVLQFATLTGADVLFEVSDAVGVIPAQVVAVLYRILQESLTNAERHGRATRIRVSITRHGPQLGLVVEDNGRGVAALVEGFGLTSMRDRVGALGGKFHIQSTAGQGFSIDVQVPIWEVAK